MVDSGGFGKFRGGLGMQRIILSRGSKNLTVNYSPYHGIPGGWGLFGGYPAGIGGDKYRLDPADLDGQFARSRYPVDLVAASEWGEVHAPDLPPLKRLNVPEGSILIDPVMVGSGYGDPLERDPQMVLNDLFNKAVSAKFAQRVYGVALDEKGEAVDQAATRKLREQARELRLKDAKPVGSGERRPKIKTNTPAVMRIHECLDIVQQGDGFSIACRKCAEDFGPADGNYKQATVYASIDKDVLTDLPPPSGRSSMGRYIEYYCPGCATLLDVETHVPSAEGEAIAPIWDMQIAPGAIRKAASRLREQSPVAAE
jgi:hypothetical protein